MRLSGDLHVPRICWLAQVKHATHLREEVGCPESPSSPYADTKRAHQARVGSLSTPASCSKHQVKSGCKRPAKADKPQGAGWTLVNLLTKPLQ